MCRDIIDMEGLRIVPGGKFDDLFTRERMRADFLARADFEVLKAHTHLAVSR